MSTRSLITCLAITTALGGVAHAQAQPGALDNAIYFEFDKSELDAQARQKLDEVAAWLKANEDRTVLIEGHTDWYGADDYNVDLGTRRAQAARRYLIEQGIDPARLLTETEGETELVSRDDAQLNRRTVFFASRRRTEAVSTTVPEQERDVEPIEPVQTVIPAEEERYLTRAGMAVSVGGGVIDFLDEQTEEFTSPGPSWDVRFLYGTELPVAVEAAYIGSAQEIDALGLDSDTALLGNGLEANARVNLFSDWRVSPYLFAGLGFTHYQLVNDDVNTSNIADDDDIVHIPAGIGLGFRAAGALFDVRGTYRAAFDDQMMDQTAISTEHDTKLNSWNVSGRVGWAF